jgi:hypothetical protein
MLWQALIKLFRISVKAVELIMRKLIFGISLTIVVYTDASATDWQFLAEGGAVFQTVNDVAIPSETGTRFSVVDAIGSGPQPYVRLEAKYQLSQKHRQRLLIAPLSIAQNGKLEKNVSYDGNNFTANTDTEFLYKFNSYRLSYAYRVVDQPGNAWDIGFTGKIRDAEVALQQGSVKSSYTNVGFVPLLYLANERRVTEQWKLHFDLDFSWSPFGRAIDLGLFARQQLNPQWQWGVGYRTVEGGADNDKVYNFAWLHYLGLQLQYTPAH